MSNQLIHFIYASTSGNVEFVMDQIAQDWRAQGVEVIMLRAEQTHLDAIKNNQLFVFATSTWEHGVLNPFFDRLVKEMKELDCSDKYAAFVGLGDIRYEPVLFCHGMIQLEEFWQKLGGQVVGHHIKINGEPFEQIDKIVKPWSDLTLAAFNQFGEKSGAPSDQA
jgi:flavodoxin